HHEADADVNEQHAKLDGIAAPAVNSARHQRTGGLGPLNWGRSAGEVASGRYKDRNTDENQTGGDDGADPVGRTDPRNREAQRQEMIQSEAEQKSDEKQEGWARNGARGFRFATVLADGAHVGSFLASNA